MLFSSFKDQIDDPADKHGHYDLNTQYRVEHVILVPGYEKIQSDDKQKNNNTIENFSPMTGP